ncbi:MAG: hydantoinase B/oxoprolinase family protein [Deltaproteobacteria bacterium]|nr:hydantoinase B/oxoprolinase family protein [Deltaproteobacteria bacterium]MBI2365992.1 hydantoinase B/oxoprolinase family protein [Deltaproteobacteria bacterium]MBI2531067.1 hydantoinase B/oxoprolinase family protein [Deltaproteobacteria bacterium]MBI3067300.1 hydantoinase B/oxoprolinase family protein [Deltaproteobacteria bacterium]
MLVDPITVEIIRCALKAAANEMSAVLKKTAYNMMIYEVQDYCVAIVDHEGRTLSQNEGALPIFLADLGVAVQDGIEVYGKENIHPGDVFLVNHPEICGQHLNNMAVYTPFFWDDKLLCFLAVRAHWIDVGGGSTGFGSSMTRDVYEEGLQIRSVKIYNRGRANTEVLRLIEDNIRFPESSLGDLRAQIACCRTGEERLEQICRKYGGAVFLEAVQTIWNQTDKLVREAVRAIPDGVYEASSFLDDDGRDFTKTIPIKVKVAVRGDELTIDFSEVADQVPGFINCGSSGGMAAARVAFKALTSPQREVNEGSFRALKVILPPGKLLSARRPAPIGGWSLSLPTVLDTIFRALAPALPERIPAAHKGDMGGYAIFGANTKTGRRYVCQNIIGGGWGGRPFEDGASSSVSMCQGDVKNTPIELQELYYPLFYECHAIRPDSGGSGKFRGGAGVEVKVRPLEDFYLSRNTDRIKCPPWGLLGGKEGQTNRTVIRRNGKEEELPGKFSRVPVRSGETVTILTAGGGGYGDPAEREPASVQRDVALGYVSKEGAKRDYCADFDCT